MQIDLLSYALGLTSGLIIWFIYSRFNKIIPVFRSSLTRYKEKIKTQNLSGVETALRAQMHRFAQQQHLASSIFSLDEIIVPPLLIAPPIYLTGDLPPVDSPTPEPEFPYTPDWPEAATALNAPRISLAEALSRGKNIAVIGTPGTGKTVALAHLASLIANQDPAAGSLVHCVPVFLHVATLDLLSTETSSFEKVVAAVAAQLSILVQPKLLSFLRSSAETGDLVFILDGVDELPISRLQSTVSFLENLRKEFPRIHIVVAASPDALNGLTALRFQPLALASWQKSSRIEFLNRWSQQWAKKIIPIIARQSGLVIPEPLLIQSWLNSDKGYFTPFEYTLRVWSAFSGQSAGTNLVPNLEAFIRQRLPEQAPRQMIEQLAGLMINKETTALPYAEIETFLSSVKINLPPSALEMMVVDEKNLNPSVGKKKRQKLTSGQWLLKILIENGLLHELSNGWISFSHLIFLGYISSSDIESGPDLTLNALPLWQVDDQALRFYALRAPKSDWLEQFIDLSDPVFFRNLQVLIRWLKDAPQQLGWRPVLYKRILNVLQNKDLPLPLRSRLITGLAAANDPAAVPVIAQCLNSQNQSIIETGLIGAAVSKDPQFIPILTELLNRAENNIRLLSVAALSNLESPETTRLVEQIITSDDEQLSVVAARCLAHHSPEGIRLLRDLLQSDAILTRRAAVLGISEIRENWVIPMLEKVAIEDGQWIVRSIAGQTIEDLKKTNPHIPAPLIRPDQSSWLIEYAGHFGEGISKGQPVTDMLLRALKTGTTEDQLSALNYLLMDNSDSVMSALYKIVLGSSGKIQDLSHYAFWLLQSSGVYVPPPAKFGL